MGSDAASAAKNMIRKLMADREAIEREVEAIMARLDSGPNPPGVKGSLVDKEGFPRADVDIFSVRQDRQRLACLTNDHKDITKQIDQALVQLHSLSKASPLGSHAPAAIAPLPGHLGTFSGAAAGPAERGASAGASSLSPSATGEPERLVAFALVDEVSQGSPAASAGIQVNDYMVSFGGVQLSAEQTSGVGQGTKLLPAVAQVLQASEGKTVQTVLLRGGQPLMFNLTPQCWEGRGLLGCHLQPL